MNLRAKLLLLGLLPFAVSTHAITIAGITFQDNAFADTLISSSGTFTTSGGTLAQVLTDKDPSTFAFSHDSGAYVELGFTDNKLVNGPGADMAIFELGALDSVAVSLTLGGTTKTYLSASTGITLGIFSLNLALVNLDDFSVPGGAALDETVIGLSIQGVNRTVPSLSLVGAINSTSVPETGSTIVLCALALLGLLTGAAAGRLAGTGGR